MAARNRRPGSGCRVTGTGHGDAESTCRKRPYGLHRIALALVCALVASGSLYAQDDQPVVRAPPGPPRFEVAVLAGVIGGGDLGDTSASMLGNNVPSGGPTALFTTSTRIGAAPTVEGRVGLRLSRALWMEGGASYGRPEFSVDISGDVEGVPGITAASRLTQVIVDGSLQYRWTRRRVTPFVMVGGGYLRQLDDLRSSVETGSVVYGGAGIRVALAPGRRGFAGRLALRGDARVLWLRGGITLLEERAATYSFTGGIVVGF